MRTPTPIPTVMPSPTSSAPDSSLASSSWDRRLAGVFAGATDDLGAVAQGLQAHGCAERLAGLLAAAGWLRHHHPSVGDLVRSSVGLQALAMFRAAARTNSVAMSTLSQDDPPHNTAIEGLAYTRLRLTASAPKVWLLDNVLNVEDCATLANAAARAGGARIRPALQQQLTALAERFHGAALQAQRRSAASSERTAVVLLAWLVDDADWLRLPSKALACRLQQGSGLLIQFKGRQGEADPLGEILFQHLSRQLTRQPPSLRLPSITFHWAMQR